MELLVVVSVIALLLALLMPVVSGMRSKALVSKSLHQLRQVGHGVLLYAAEHDNALPGPLYTSVQPRIRKSDQNQLATRIAPYLGYSVDDTWRSMEEMLFASWGEQAAGYDPAAGGLSTLMCNWNDYDRAELGTRPFGYPGSDPWSSDPVRVHGIDETDRLWLLCEQAWTDEEGETKFLTSPGERMFLFANGGVRLEAHEFQSYE